MVNYSTLLGGLDSFYRTREELSKRIVWLYQNKSAEISTLQGITANNWAEKEKTDEWEPNYRQMLRMAPVLQAGLVLGGLVAEVQNPGSITDSTTLSTMVSLGAVDSVVRVADTIKNWNYNSVVPLFAVGAIGKMREYLGRQ